VPTVLWTKHDDVRFELRALAQFIDEAIKNRTPDNIQRVIKHATKTASDVMDIVFREENILYPTVKVLLTPGEWYAIRLEEDSIGHYKVNPPMWAPEGVKPLYPHEIEPVITPEDLINLPQYLLKTVKGLAEGGLEPDHHKIERPGDIKLTEGYLSPQEIDAIFRTLPVDITFIDKDDRVRFFSGGHRIFARNKTILGRKVELCHPPKSVHIVKKILKAFKEGRKQVAEFWIPFGGRLVHIRYFPVRDSNGEYLGTLEVVQDITDIKKIEGEKRLLDWED
jgi:PAS domain S-box-containing protein